MDGWIKLHRKMIEWEWYEDAGTRLVFLHLLLVACYKDTKWRGITIKRGQALGSLSRLSKATGLSIQQARNKLTNLQTTGEVTCKSTNKYTIYTLQNYDKYQSNNTQENKQTTRKPTSILRSKEIKEDKNNTKVLQKSQYGDKDITMLIEYFKTTFELPALDESEATNRRFCYLLINKFSVEQVRLLINTASKDRFWSTRLSSFKTLYYKAVQIISSSRSQEGGVTKI